MTGPDDIEEGSDPTAKWDERRRRWEAEMQANTKRALELLGTLQPRPVEVRGVRRGRRRVLVRRVRL